jgi:hypothetical protein
MPLVTILGYARFEPDKILHVQATITCPAHVVHAVTGHKRSCVLCPQICQNGSGRPARSASKRHHASLCIALLLTPATSYPLAPSSTPAVEVTADK